MSLAPTHGADEVVGQCDGPPGQSVGGRDAEPGGTQNPATIPGGLQEHKTRILPDGSLLEFEYAPAGYLTKGKGEPRLVDWRAYFHTPVGGKRTRMVSVTTLLDCILPKGGLPSWAEARGIEGAVRATEARRDHLGNGSAGRPGDRPGAQARRRQRSRHGSHSWPERAQPAGGMDADG